MDKLLKINGGMPLRIDDFELIQRTYREGFQSLISGLITGNVRCILSGMQIIRQDGIITITEGYMFEAGEIFYVPQTSGPGDENNVLYLIPDLTTSESRHFHDGTTHNVWEIRRYQALIRGVIPPGGIAYGSFKRIEDIIAGRFTVDLNALSEIKGVSTIPYNTGFRRGTSYNSIRLQANGLNGTMIHAAFYADTDHGAIGRIPEGLRPTGDLFGTFSAGNKVGALQIRADGYIYVEGCSTTAVNYISFQYYSKFEDFILFQFSTGLPD